MNSKNAYKSCNTRGICLYNRLYYCVFKFACIQSENTFGVDFCLRYGKSIDPAGQGLPLATVGRVQKCDGLELWERTGQIGDEYLCCASGSLQHTTCSVPPPLF